MKRLHSKRLWKRLSAAYCLFSKASNFKFQCHIANYLFTYSGTRELTLKCKLKCYFKPMNNPLAVSPSKGKQGNHTRQRKNLLTSVGIEPTAYGLDLPSLCRLSYKVAQRKSGTILDGESRRRESMGTNECCAA